MTTKSAAQDAILDARDALLRFSHTLHANPETAWQEHESVRACVALLAEFGIAAEIGVAGLETAFIAEFGDSGPCIALCCEYDALPEIGHACGHNIIATAAIGAAIGLARSGAPMRVRLVGTPAEESGAGKALLVNRGVFDGADAALMVHPYYEDVADFVSFAGTVFAIDFTGVPAHAVLAPERGVNASDAALLFQNAVALLRQQLPQNTWIQAASHVDGDLRQIPDHATVNVGIRSRSTDIREAVRSRVEACAEGAAIATGCTVAYRRPPHQGYDAFELHEPLARAYEANAAELGRSTFHPGVPTTATDMGNVSRVVPSLHALIGIDTDGAMPHSLPFKEAAVGPSGDRAAIDGAIALAWTAIDVAAGGVPLTSDTRSGDHGEP